MDPPGYDELRLLPMSEGTVVGELAVALEHDGDVAQRVGIRDPVLTVVDVQADRGAALAVDLDVGEGRRADEVDSGLGDVAAGDRQGLDRLVQRAGTDDLDLDRAGLADDARHRTGDGV